MGAAEQWSYAEESGRGPSAWTRLYPAGKRQSPINILIDYCDLHQSACASCQRQPLPCRLEGKLKLNDDDADYEEDDHDARANNSRGHLQQHHHHQHGRRHHNERRGHLDSVGNENDSDELQNESDSQQYYRPEAANAPASGGGDQSQAGARPQRQLASECLTLWKSKKLAGPLQLRKPQQQQQQQVKPARQQERQNTRYCVTNKKIFLGYPRFLNTIQLSNTGHGWQVDMPRELACHTLLCGPPLGDREYRLAQFHCHWGADCAQGSEHQLNGQSFSAELHFVHWNCSQFGSLAEAARHRQGLCVLAVFVQALEGELSRNKHLDNLMAGIKRVRELPEAAPAELVNTKLDLKKLFPVNRWDYATYEGSLTTPPLSEVVDWIVFLQPIQCSASQVAEFRRLQCLSGPLTSNCRPVQAANERLVTIWTHSHSH